MFRREDINELAEATRELVEAEKAEYGPSGKWPASEPVLGDDWMPNKRDRELSEGTLR